MRIAELQNVLQFYPKILTKRNLVPKKRFWSFFKCPREGGWYLWTCPNQLSWKIGEENSSSPPKNFIWQWKISPISHISSLLLLNSSQFNSFCNFWEGKTQNFWRYAPILVQIDMSSSPSPHARAKNWGRKHVPSTVGVGKETGSVARILTSGL